MKLTKHAWILWSIALIVVLVLALVIPFVKTAVYWIALGCTLAMFGVCIFAFVRAFRRNDKLESKLLGWPIFKVGFVALTVQIIVGFTLMALAGVLPVWGAAIAELAVFAGTAFCLTVKDASREAVTQMEVKVPDQTEAWKTIRARAAAIAASSGHPELKKLADAIRYADPMSTSMDAEIAQMLEILSSYADADNVRKAFAMLEQRKALAKESK